MNMLTTISNSIIPMVIFAVVLYGCIKKTNVKADKRNVNDRQKRTG